MTKVLETHADRAVALVERRVQVHSQTGDGRQLSRADGLRPKALQALFRRRQVAGQEFAFGPVRFKGKRNFMTAFPGVARQKRSTGGEIF